MRFAPSFSTRRLQQLAATVATALIVGSAGCAMLDAKQREWIFQPSDKSWGGANTQGMQDVWIDYASQAGQQTRLHGLWMPAARRDAPLLLYLHGARWNVSGSSPRIRRMNELGFSVLAIDYRGFGQSSQGLPSEDMATEDAQAAWNWLAKQGPDQPRYIFGHSLGGAIAIDLARSVDNEAGVMVEGTFTSIADVVSSFRWGWLPVGPLITQRFDSVDKVAQIGSPLLVVHGTADKLIPPELGQRLFAAAQEPKRLLLIDGGTHHNTQALAQSQYRKALKDFFHTQRPPAKQQETATR